MIFKKIYTFLNNYFNGKKISKVFSTLIFTLIFSGILFFSAYLADVSAQDMFPHDVNDEQESIDYEALEQELRRDKQASSAKVQENKRSSPTVQYKSSDLSGVLTNEFYILYQKQGLPPNKIYTLYLPPKDTYDKNTSTEHSLDFCGSIGNSGLKMIGRDCMIKIPFDCSAPPVGITPREASLADPSVVPNCLKYSNVFHNTATGKKLNPKECANGLGGDKISCLSTEKNYCHLTEYPILGINCKLAPCNFISNDQYRRPGVNCLADCNKSPGENISQAKFFMEGFNCLSSCKSFPSTPTKVIGQDCVLEFNEYVMPLCTNHPNEVTKHFNKANRQDRRESCLDVEDLPICVGAPEQIDLKNCVNECNRVNVPLHNKNCVNFDSTFNPVYKTKTCHSYRDLDSLNSDPNCHKTECHKLSNTELARSLNVYDSGRVKSTAKFCFPSTYTKFSFAQFKAINSRSDPKPYLRDYLLDYKPCYSRGDTEEIETIVSSAYYGSSNSSKIDYLRSQAQAMITSSHAAEAMETTQGNRDFLYYNSELMCPLDNVSQEISCKKYKELNHARHYDCNSASFCQDCEQASDICGKDTDEYCFKNGINCNSSFNKIYQVCEGVTSRPRPDKDEYVSWFFRPTVSVDALKKREGQGYYLVNMKGYPTEGAFKSDGNDYIYMDIDDMKSNGYGEYFFGIDALWGISRAINPPSNGREFGIPGVGAGNLCGMWGNYRGTPNEDAGYFKGEVRTTYEDDNKVSHEVDVCLRYASGSAPYDNSCGYRKCRTTCAFGICTNLCGIDVCRPLKIIEGGNTFQNCKSNEYNFKNWNKAECISTFETNLDAISRQTRVRIYKPEDSSNYICAVIEFHGITTRHLSNPYFKGDEYFEVPDQNDVTKTRKMCASGVFIESSQSCINGVDTNSDDFNTNVWRTAAKIKYIASPKEEYYDQYGIGPVNLPSNHIDFKTHKRVNQTIGRVNFNIKQYLETSDCIRHQLRISAPPFPSIGTPSNARRLFLPPVEIEKKCEIATLGNDCTNVDATDFFKPAITILYGEKDISRSVLSSDLNDQNTNYKIVKIQDPTSNISGDYVINAGNIGIAEIDISQTVFARKESSGSQPLFCLYRKTVFGARADQFKEDLIQCVNRKRATRATINSPSSPVNTNLEFQVRFLKDEGDLHSSITSPFATQSFRFPGMLQNINNNEYLKVCAEIPSQGFPICIQRDECSLLNNECVENEKALINSKNSANLELGTIKQQELVSNYCKKELLVNCNLRKGYKLTASNQTLNTSTDEGVGFNELNHPNYHGWFNEFCIVSGIAKLDDPNKKVYVQRNINEDKQLGSCLKDPNCSSCDDFRCLRASCCKIIPNNDLLSFGTFSLATPHELGLCYELNVYLKSCPALSYGKNSDISDPFYIGESFLNNISLYQENGITPKAGVIFTKGHKSHLDRYNSSILSYDSKNAEYEVAYAGISALRGKCVGFYKNRIPENDPIASCNSDGRWEGFIDGCKMHSCPDKKLPTSNPGANSNGKYPSSYDSTNSEDGSKRGFSEGYANWNSLQKTKIIKESSTATSCIVGYAKKDAINASDAMSIGEFSSSALLSAVNSYMSTLPSEKIKVINSLYKKYTGFAGGTPPTRNCNQRGVWETVTNACERITCPPIHFDEPAEAGAFYMNDYGLQMMLVGAGVSGRKTIYSENSPYGPLSLNIPTKAKFIITSSVSSANSSNPVYLSVTNLDNSFLIMDSSGLNSASINKDIVYVVELKTEGSTKFWRIMPNSKDNVLKILWNKSGGAYFDETGYALRGDFDYEAMDEGDKHKVIGTCNGNMGYRSLSDQSRPQLTCNSKGNWINLINPCISDCEAVLDPVARDAVHGFATWEKSSAAVGESKVEESMKPGPPQRGGCVSGGYYPYPYPPLYDNEGTKKDFGIGAIANGDTPFNTSDNYHATAFTSDGATFVAQAGAGENLNPSATNFNGIAYNLKIQTSNSQSQSQSQSVASAAPQEAIQTLFYLFSTDTPLTISAPTQNDIWSKISFSSFGTPEYSSTEENIAENPDCRSPYSKLIFANKCIGKTSCSIGLSDFTSYDTNSCIETNPGKGGDGQQNDSNERFGSGGGGGGGNKPGIGGSPTSSISINGTSGSSFYDKSFHLELGRPILSDAGNKGLKVDLKVADATNTLFKGKDGSVKIMESTTQGFGSIARTANYTTPGVHDHTVTTGSTNQDIYIKYEMSGAGGGGGGQGLTQGTDGASGSKMTGGIFKVKRGDVLKIYVGGGGGAGKTKCRSSGGAFLDPKITQPAIEIIEPAKKTNLAIKMFENYQSNPDQIITHNTKIIDQDSAIKSPLAKIFSKISDIFISEGYAYAHCSGYGNQQYYTPGCSGWDSGNLYYRCDCSDGDPVMWGYEDGNYGGSYGTYGAGVTQLTGRKDKLGSFKLGSHTYVQFECWGGTGEWTGWFNYDVQYLSNHTCLENGRTYSLNDNIDRINMMYLRDCGGSGFSYQSNTCACNTGRYWNGSACANITCPISAGTGYTARTLNYASSSFACDTSGYTGNISYNCNANNTPNLSGSCTAITCPISAGTGYTARTLDYASSSFACNTSGYAGNISYNCNANNTPNLSGSCTAITCAVPATANVLATITSVNYSTTTTSAGLTCKAGYSGPASYTCTAVVNNGVTSATGAYTAVNNCTENTCNVLAGNGYSAKTGKKSVGSFDCDEGYYGTVSYTCETNNGNATIKSETCTRIKCNLPEGAKSNITPVGDSLYREVDYSPISAPKTYACGSGYRKTFDATNYQEIDPTYTCVGNSDKSNPATVAYRDACVPITCAIGVDTYNFQNGQDQVFPCDNTSGFWGQMTLRCNVDGRILWIQRCNDVKCLITNDKNTTIDGQLVGFSTSMVEMDCKPGYYYGSSLTRPKYQCTYSNTGENRGLLTFAGSCQRITCQIPNTLHSIIDNTSVDWNGGTYTATTCREGFYQSSPNLPPKYSCLGGEAIIMNACTPVTCDLAERFGMLAKTNLEYGTKKTTSCDKLGYSGSVEYNCVNPVSTSGKGTATIVSSTCAESSCFASDNSPATFNFYVTPTGSSSLSAGGIGGKISDAIEFLKGGNGGSATGVISTVGSATTSSRTSGSGGGGGSASMITINKRIIAIAGGGGGGAGGGGVENNSNAVEKISNVENLEIKLSSNVFGPYFIGKMEYTPINIDAQKTSGIIYDKIISPETQFSLNAPSGTFINDVFFSSYGSPTVNFDSPDSLVLKDGECNDPSSLTKSIDQCVGKTSCLINTSTLFPSCQSVNSKKFGLVASYYFKEPTLQVVNSEGLPSYQLKQRSSSQNVPATNLVNGTVYTFVLNREENIWLKYPYKSDEYLIKEPFTEPKIRVKFHRTNTTFSPRLKTSQGSWTILKSEKAGETSSLSVGYIDDKKVYILTKSSDNWIIREHTPLEVDGALPRDLRTFPKRSCMTTNISSAGAVNVLWSLPNSSCVNYCPGYDMVTGIGDDRINVGATKHSTSKGEGIVYWKNGTIGSTSIMKFSNVKDLNSGVFPEVTDTILTPSHFRSGKARQYFALARYCNEFGVWDKPVPLCAFSNLQDSDPDAIPVDSPTLGTSYIHFNQNSPLISSDGTQKYIKVGSDIVNSTCKAGGYKEITNDQFYNSGSTVYQPPKYNCVNDVSKNVDQVYFNEVPDASRKSCVKYCDINNFPSRSSVHTSNVANRFVRPSQDLLVNGLLSPGQIAIECRNGYFMTSSTPQAKCTSDGLGGLPWNVENDCRLARYCYVSSLNKDQGESNNKDKNWFPLAKYITPEHRNAGSIASGTVMPFPVNGGSFQTQFGKCGYCSYQFEACTIWGCSKRGYERKYLKSYSCNDGNWSAEWDYDDGVTNIDNDYVNGRPPPYNRACDDDDWDWSREDEEDHPNQLYLGSCESDNKTNAFNNYNNLRNWP